MASLYMGSAIICQNAISRNFCLPRPRPFICRSITKRTPDNISVDILPRRSGNYPPSPWDHRYLLSIENQYAKEKNVITRDLLKKKVRKMLDVDTKSSRLEQLELIDDLEKLGVSHHFEVEINNILNDYNHKIVWKCDKEEDLHATALGFRLLRQHGFDVSEDIFDVIVDKIESDTCKSDGINSIISLYEASYLTTKRDTKLHGVIRPFATEKIRKFVDGGETCNAEVREKAIHALEMPYHWRMRRLEARWYIDAYEKKHDNNIDLFEFAKIDFNIWADLCKAYLVEANWYKKGYKPSVKEYMQNAWISVSAPVILNYFYCVFSDQISTQVMETLSQNRQDVVRCSGTVLRLANDLGTSPDEMARGDVLKSIQCYMHETGASEKEARAHVQQMISETWDEMNYVTQTANSSSSLSRGFVKAALNLGRMSQCMYQHGDGHGFPDKAKTVDRVMSLLINPIP
ncbi:hypothetical protein Bca4012_059847 [Brassica carinata]